MADTAFPPVPELRAPWPNTAKDLFDELRRIHAESVPYWSAYATPEFLHRKKQDVWAPVDQVRHLTKSMRAVTRGLEMPRFFLTLRFGRSKRSSRTLEKIHADYKALLARGATAGDFAPRATPVMSETMQNTEQGRRLMEQNRELQMRHHQLAVTHMSAAVLRWSESALEDYVLPHPLLGKLTVREMMYFTLIHNVHHVQVAERRRRENQGG